MSRTQPVGIIESLRQRKVLLAGSAIGIFSTLAAGYVLAIRQLPVTATFRVTIPVGASDNFATFARQCFFDTERMTGFAASSAFGATGPGITPSSAPRRETDDKYDNSLVRLERLSSAPTNTEISITISSKSPAGPLDPVIETAFDRLLRPSMVCWALLRERGELHEVMNRVFAEEQRNLFAYRFYVDAYQNRIAALKRNTKPETGRSPQFPAVNAFVMDGRLSVMTGVENLAPSDQQKVLQRTIDDAKSLIASTNAFLTNQLDLLRSLGEIDMTGSLTQQRADAQLDQLALKYAKISDVISTFKSKVSASLASLANVKGFGKDSKIEADIVMRYRPKLRNLAIIAVVSSIASVLLTIFVNTAISEMKRTAGK